MKYFYIITNNNNLVYVRTLKLGKSPFGLNNDSTYENAIHFDDKEEAEKVADELNKTFASFARRKKDLFKVTRVYNRKQDNIDDFDFIRRVVVAYFEKKHFIGLPLYKGENSSLGLYMRRFGYSRIYKHVTISGDNIVVSGDIQLDWPREHYIQDAIKPQDVNKLDDTFIHNVAKRIREVHKDFIKEYNLD